MRFLIGILMIMSFSVQAKKSSMDRAIASTPSDPFISSYVSYRVTINQVVVTKDNQLVDFIKEGEESSTRLLVCESLPESKKNQLTTFLSMALYNEGKLELGECTFKPKKKEQQKLPCLCQVGSGYLNL